MHAAIGVMDKCAWLRLPRVNRHLESCDDEAGQHVRLQSPTDDAPAERIQHDYQIGELLAHAHVRHVGHPGLIDAGKLHLTSQIRHNSPAMIGLRRNRNEGPFAQAEKVVLAHQSRHAFVIGNEALLPKLDGDPSIT
jgi:hypothetical protein